LPESTFQAMTVPSGLPESTYCVFLPRTASHEGKTFNKMEKKKPTLRIKHI
jgi:hypothetical protein